MNECISYADQKLEKMFKTVPLENGKEYYVEILVGGEKSRFVYDLVPYGVDREGGDAQLTIDHLLDLRFEQEHANYKLNMVTDIAYDYITDISKGKLVAYYYQFAGITFRKGVARPAEMTMSARRPIPLVSRVTRVMTLG